MARPTGSITSEEFVLDISVQAGVATLTLDSPANRNALSREMRRRLRDGLAAAENDESVRMVVLDHAGRVFCSGMDLDEASGATADDQGLNEFPALLETIWNYPKPVLATVRGPARAGGIGLLAACDIVVAGASATFGFAEVRIGVVPAIISAVVLPRMVPNVAHRLMLTGEVFDSATALIGGLVDFAVPDAEVDATVASQVLALSAGGPLALAATKRLLRDRSGPALTERFADLLTLSARFFAAPEGQEGITAFREKRPAHWISGSD